MARIVIVGSVAVDELLELAQPLRPYAHLDGRPSGRRLGGGAANTARPLARAGHEVTVVSAVGTDEDGDFILERLAAEGIGTQTIARVPGPSTRSLVLLDADRERTIVNLHRCVEPEGAARLRDLPADAVYVRSREGDVAPHMAARLEDALVLAHVPPLAPGSRPAHLLVGSAGDLPAKVIESPWELGIEVGGACLRAFVVTHGALGAVGFSPEGRLTVPAPRVDVHDSTGAGDAFAAGLLHALTAGKALPAALETACAWGAREVETPRPGEERPLRSSGRS